MWGGGGGGGCVGWPVHSCGGRVNHLGGMIWPFRATFDPICPCMGCEGIRQPVLAVVSPVKNAVFFFFFFLNIQRRSLGDAFCSDNVCPLGSRF